MSAFFDPSDAKDTTFQQRADAYEAKMNALHTAYPNDVDGAAFDALAMKHGGNRLDNEVRAVYGIEMHDWKMLAAETPAPGSKEYLKFDTYWGQGVAAGHLKDAKLAASALREFDKGVDALKKSPYASRISSMEVERNEMVGWQAFGENKPEEAVTAMRRAADQQDELGQGEVDIPAREMVGDLLMMEERPDEALVEYKMALKLSPNRLNG